MLCSFRRAAQNVDGVTLFKKGVSGSIFVAAGAGDRPFCVAWIPRRSALAISYRNGPEKRRWDS